MEADLEDVRPCAPLRLQVTRSRLLGRGVAFELVCPELVALRAELARRWAAWLTPQDRQGPRPHVTIQNKVTPPEARALKERLDATFVPFSARGEGWLLWRYLGGPWALETELGFAPSGRVP